MILGEDGQPVSYATRAADKSLVFSGGEIENTGFYLGRKLVQGFEQVADTGLEIAASLTDSNTVKRLLEERAKQRDEEFFNQPEATQIAEMRPGMSAAELTGTIVAALPLYSIVIAAIFAIVVSISWLKRTIRKERKADGPVTTPCHKTDGHNR